MVQSTSVRRSMPLATTLLVGLAGSCVIALLTQVRIPLPFTPVPITGQTFAVLLWPLLFGRTAGLTAVGAYLAAGVLGAPVFAGFTAMSAVWGPTSGYLFGFLVAAYAVGSVHDRSLRTRGAGMGRLLLTIATIVLGTAIILACGAGVLAAFVGAENVWSMGVAPFLAGDVVKTILLVISIGIAQWTTRN
jgi:biotin transport system substrate-specific component